MILLDIDDIHMISTDYSLQTVVDSIFSIPGLITGLVGVLASLVIYKLEFLSKKDWFGNSCSVWTGAICIAVIIVLLTFKFFWFLPCVLLIPSVVIGSRYCWLEHRKKKVLKYKGLLDYDKKRYDYYVWLSKRELFRWEVKTYLLPAMNILFEIGSIKKLDDELELLSDYKDWYKWKRLKSYVYWNRHEYRDVIDLMTPYVNDGTLNRTELARVTINIYGAYRILEDKEGIEIYVRKLENILFEQKVYMVELFDDLMYYYDEHGEKEKIERLVAVIKGLRFSDYSQLLEVYDVLYMHNRRHNDTKANKELLDLMVSKSSMMNEEERKKVFEVRLLKLYFENDYGWKDYSIKLFEDANTYLNYSSRVAFEYLRAINQIVQQCHMHNMSAGDGIIRLYDVILDRVAGYVQDFDRELLELPDDFLYRKKEMLMMKEEYRKARANFKLEYHGYLKGLADNMHKVISLCQRVGDEREKLHFLVVLVDEIVAFEDDIARFRTLDNKTEEEEKALQAISDEEMILAKTEAIECVQELNQTLKRHDYNRTLAYYIFYAAYLNMKLDDRIMAKQMLARFHATGVDIRHYTLAVQELYKTTTTALGAPAMGTDPVS